MTASPLCFVASLPLASDTHTRQIRTLSKRHFQLHPVPPADRCRRSYIPPSARVRRGFKPEPDIPETLYDAKPIKDVDFQPFDFSTLKGKVVLVANGASQDIHTDSHYKLFADLLDKYQDSGLEVMVFPSNWYGQKELPKHEQIKQFVHSTYSDKIVVMSKTDLEWNQVFALGRKYHPGEVIWNFHGKFLFGRTGLPVQRFDLLTENEYLESQVRHYLTCPIDEHSVQQPKETYDDDEDYATFGQAEVEEEAEDDGPEVEDEPEEEVGETEETE